MLPSLDRVSRVGGSTDSGSVRLRVCEEDGKEARVLESGRASVYNFGPFSLQRPLLMGRLSLKKQKLNGPSFGKRDCESLHAEFRTGSGALQTPTNPTSAVMASTCFSSKFRKRKTGRGQPANAAGEAQDKDAADEEDIGVLLNLPDFTEEE